jgi:uncharacterized protein YdaT
MGITVNIEKAKDITKDRLRAERKPLLEEQDLKFMQAQEKSADTTAIVAEKKRLRDITNQVDSMTTVEELKGATIS